MITKILGIIWVAAGSFGVIWPGYFKKRLGKRLSVRIRRIVILFLMVLGHCCPVKIYKFQ